MAAPLRDSSASPCCSQNDDLVEMKITIVLGAFFSVPPLMGGAVEKVWFTLAQEFARLGHEVTQISRSQPDLPAAEEIEKVQHLRIPGMRSHARSPG